MKQKHIFIVFHNFGLGGVQKKILDIANFVAQSSKYKNIALHLLIRDKTKFSFEKKLIKNNSRLKIHYSPELFNRSFCGLKHLFYGLDLITQIIKYQPTHILLFLHFSLPFLILAKTIVFWKKFELIVSQDNILSLYNHKKYSDRVFPNWIIKFMYRLTDKIIVQTKFAQDDLIKNYGVLKNKIIVIQNWIIDKPKKTKRQDRTYDFIYCGRFAPQKNLSLMIKAMKLIVVQKPNAKLLLVGDGADKNQLKEIVKKLHLEKNVKFVNSTHQVSSYLQQSKIFLLTSYFEGHPLILLEAMKAGVVPLVLNYPGLNEYLENNKTGFIANDIASLAKKGVSILEDEKLLAKISGQAQQAVKIKNNKFLIEKTISETMLKSILV